MSTNIRAETFSDLAIDVQRLIVECAAQRGTKACLNLSLVSKSFAAWVKPVLYSVVKIMKYCTKTTIAERVGTGDSENYVAVMRPDCRGQGTTC
ncbi:hypothetical protein SISNIDRAFT_460081, partial [Sistotremastrum niveocremeum HHB9708]